METDQERRARLRREEPVGGDAKHQAQQAMAAREATAPGNTGADHDRKEPGMGDGEQQGQEQEGQEQQGDGQQGGTHVHTDGGDASVQTGGAAGEEQGGEQDEGGSEE